MNSSHTTHVYKLEAYAVAECIYGAYPCGLTMVYENTPIIKLGKLKYSLY